MELSIPLFKWQEKAAFQGGMRWCYKPPMEQILGGKCVSLEAEIRIDNPYEESYVR